MADAISTLAESFLVQPPFQNHQEILGVGQDGAGGQGAAVGEFVGGEFAGVHHVKIDRPHLSVRQDLVPGE